MYQADVPVSGNVEHQNESTCLPYFPAFFFFQFLSTAVTDGNCLPVFGVGFPKLLCSAVLHSEPEAGNELLILALLNSHFPHAYSIRANPALFQSRPHQDLKTLMITFSPT